MPDDVVKAVVFDLDDTLFDPLTIPAETMAPAWGAARRANEGPGAVSTDMLEEALTATRRRGFTFVADAYRLPARVRAAWRAACGAITLRGPLAPYPDVVPALRRLDVARYLLTTGYRRLQESKIDALGIRDLFDAIYIDALDAGPTAGKEPLLRAILDEHGLAPREVLVVGDNPESEIAAANRVGTVTAQIIRPGVSYAERAEHHLITLDELPDLVHRLRT